MRTVKNAIAALMLVMTASCGGGGGVYGPSEQDINNTINNTLSTAAGTWMAFTTPPTGVRLDFNLQQGSNGQVSGTGTMKENETATPVPITVSGTFYKPALTLAFDGMVVEGRAVKGSTQGSYTSLGIATTLTLTAPGYSRDIPIILQKN